MPLFVMLTHLSSGAMNSPDKIERWEKAAVGRIESEKLQVSWKGSYAVLGPYDYVDIFSAPSNDVAMQVAAIIRTFGHAETEVWPATTWDEFKELIRELPLDRGADACGWVRG